MDFFIKKKYFSKEDNLFHIIKHKDKLEEEKTYASFNRFYKALNKNLEDADLLDYDFDGIDLNKYDLSKAKISSTVMIKLGIYKDNIFKIVTKDSNLSDITLSTNFDLVDSRKPNEITDEEVFALCYISDLHINHKLINRFKNSANIYELDAYLKEIVYKLKRSLPTFTYNYSIVFIGDISYNFEVFKLFFRVFRAELPYRQTFVILGNHELWDTKLNKRCKSIEEIINEYRKFLNELKIILLENQLFLPNDEQKIYT